MYKFNQEIAFNRYGPIWLEASQWYRENCLVAHLDPEFVMSHLDHQTVKQKLNAEFNCSALNRTIMFEALSYGDPSFLLTTPGPSLSGVLLEVMGNQSQQDIFVNYVKNHTSRSFFAVTEPQKGSDAANMNTALTDGVILNGEKLLVGNGATAPIGTTLYKTGGNFLGLGAVLLTPDILEQCGVSRKVLDIYALKGTQLSYLDFSDVRIDSDLILGTHLNPIERGMMSLLKTFHLFRPAVSSMCIGHAQALLDYFKVNSELVDEKLGRALNVHQNKIDLARNINRESAIEVDKNPLKGGKVSLAKQLASKSLENLSNDIFDLIDYKYLIQDAWLMKSLTDTFGYEYMEGTSHIHLKNVYSSYKRKEILVTSIE